MSPSVFIMFNFLEKSFGFLSKNEGKGFYPNSLFLGEEITF